MAPAFWNHGTKTAIEPIADEVAAEESSTDGTHCDSTSSLSPCAIPSSVAGDGHNDGEYGSVVTGPEDWGLTLPSGRGSLGGNGSCGGASNGAGGRYGATASATATAAASTARRAGS